MAHFNKRKNTNLGKRGVRKRKKPRQSPCVRIVLHILILIRIGFLMDIAILRFWVRAILSRADFSIHGCLRTPQPSDYKG
jgi:hypothetical protein